MTDSRFSDYIIIPEKNQIIRSPRAAAFPISCRPQKRDFAPKKAKSRFYGSDESGSLPSAEGGTFYPSPCYTLSFLSMICAVATYMPAESSRETPPAISIYRLISWAETSF